MGIGELGLKGFRVSATDGSGDLGFRAQRKRYASGFRAQGLA